MTCILAGDLDAYELIVAAVISEKGAPFITQGEIIGTEAGEMELTMSGFEDLFSDYSVKKHACDPHTGFELELQIFYQFPFWAEWNKG